MKYTADGDLRKFDVHCSILFTDLPLLQRPAAAKAAGFEAVEFWWPFGENPVPGDKEVDEFVTAISDAGVQLIGLNFIDLVPAARGLVSVPGREAEFRDNIDVTVGIAERLGCRSLNALYGNRIA
ncbi:TIM barrel protein, partial [Nocardia tengchongensis]